MSGWGLKFFDYDNDGNMDLMTVNGFPDDLVEQLSHHVTYKELPLLFVTKARPLTTSARKAGQFSLSHSPLEVKLPLPSGAVERFTDLPVDRYITIVEGKGMWK